MYFRLNPEIMMITGKNGSILCDCFTGKVFHLNIAETEIIVNAENNLKIKPNTKILKELEKNCLGTFYEKIPYIHKFRKIDFTSAPNKDSSFKNFFLEISSKCNNKCLYCGSKNKFKRTLGCLGCNLFEEEGVPLTLIEYYEIIDTIANLGCDNLYLVGGDPTLDINLTNQIIDYCSNKEIPHIFIVCSIKNDYKKISDLINDKENINLIIQIEYNELKYISDEELYLLVIFEEEQKYINNIELNESNILIDFLKYSNLSNPNLDNNYSFDLDSFYHNLNFHPCLGKTLFVSTKGNLYPCPLYKSKNFGNIKNNSLLNFLKKNKNIIYEFWSNNLDFVNGCAECEFRYLCSDCRACEEEITNELNQKKLCHLGF